MVECKHCGALIDEMTQKKCEYCGCDYRRITYFEESSQSMALKKLRKEREVMEQLTKAHQELYEYGETVMKNRTVMPPSERLRMFRCGGV